jgi:glycosyltransferase involved in cell wall biosynthesis
VATTGGALPEVVGKDGETGLLVAPDDPGALASAIARILDDPGLADRLGRGGRERVLGRFTWRATAEGTTEQYRIALDQSASRNGRPERLRAAEYQRGPLPLTQPARPEL